MIVVTDACLPIVASGEQPILARILINFELPTKKVCYNFLLPGDLKILASRIWIVVDYIRDLFYLNT